MNEGTSAISIVSPQQVAIQRLNELLDIVKTVKSSVLRPGTDYGDIPGASDKPVLLLPGMEKLLRVLSLRAEYKAITITEDFDKPLFMYRYECRLIEVDTGMCVATAIGSANSREGKWGYRWVKESDIPEGLDKTTLKTRGGSIFEYDFAIEKAETSGQYGKPAEYWQQFKDAIAAGTARKVQKAARSGKMLDGWEINSTVYRVVNEDVYDQVNTIDKIAQKRALSSAIKCAAAVSEFFTIDLEDLPGNVIQMPSDEIVDAEFSVETIEKVSTPQPAPKAAKTATESVFGKAKSDEEILASLSRPAAPAAAEGWATDERLDMLLTKMQDTRFATSKQEFMVAAGIETWNDYAAWNKAYSTGSEAFNKVMEELQRKDLAAADKFKDVPF